LRETAVAGRLPLSDRLGSDSFQTDKTPHLRVDDPRICVGCELKPCIRVCPAEVYHWETDHLRINYENCLELGACRVACLKMGKGALRWEYPQASRGVQFRFG
jgi:ferredoxin like protein